VNDNSIYAAINVSLLHVVLQSFGFSLTLWNHKY